MKDSGTHPGTGRKAIRESVSGYPEDWDLLDEIQRQGLAKGRSGAFQYLCAAYRRFEEERAFIEQARKIDPDELAALTNSAGPTATTPSWSELLREA